jgi:hypothetical protein
VKSPLAPAADILPAAGHRHLIQNALALYCRAMDEHDAAAAGQLLCDARLHFKNQPVVVGADAIVALYAAGFRNPTPTRHLISNLLVQPKDQTITYQATYQRWSLAGPAPVCEVIGEYRGLFTTDRDRWAWTEHRILHF